MTISVIIATYGGEEWKTLAATRAVPSLKDQHPSMTIVLHDTHGTRASSLNDGARESLSEWLVFLDADDELSPGYIQAMREAAEGDHEGDVLFTPAVVSIRKGKPGAPFFFERPNLTLREDNWLVIGTMIHKDLFWKVGGFPDYPHGFEDWALWSKCYRLGARVLKVPEAIYRYHHNPQSAHKQAWRDRKTQVATHQRVAAELDAWEAAL